MKPTEQTSITVNTTNAAFDDTPGHELTRIPHKLPLKRGTIKSYFHSHRCSPFYYCVFSSIQAFLADWGTCNLFIKLAERVCFRFYTREELRL